MICKRLDTFLDGVSLIPLVKIEVSRISCTILPLVHCVPFCLGFTICLSVSDRVIVCCLVQPRHLFWSTHVPVGAREHQDHVLSFSFSSLRQSMSFPPHASGQNPRDKKCTMRSNFGQTTAMTNPHPGIQWITEQPRGHGLADPHTKDTARTSNTWVFPRSPAW